MSHERIQSVSFQTNGCLNTNAWANTVAELAEVRKVEDAWEITAEDVIAYLETLPPPVMYPAPSGRFDQISA